MSQQSERLSGVHTNVITGFLGAGKSTAVLKLLEQKPENERWAILVNEFGEVGIDGGLISGNQTDNNIFIREVPGGCMCCTAGLPMQMAMNMLLARARPDRLIIEPTGLGHPYEVLSVLSTEHYQELLHLQATVTLVDARKISDHRYTDHTTFNQQLEIADVVVASKSDLYEPRDLENLRDYLDKKNWLTDRRLEAVTDGALDISWLQQPRRALKLGEPVPDRLNPDEVVETSETATQFPPEGYIRMTNRGDGFASIGWVFQPTFRFDSEKLATLLSSTRVERIKALMRTNAGDIGYNFAGDSLEQLQLQPLEDSRLELIADEGFKAGEFESALMAAALTE